MSGLDTPLLSIDQAAEYLNVRPSWLRAKVAARQVPHRRLGKHVRFTAEDIAEILTAALHHPAPAQRSRPRPHRYRAD
ncbi:excisionase family DNA binding protein [Murinocardiopsis flavida]|uniref:Excisionase family DNA binding protein n=1 Tax=Murinocardiopsis flavida TaxID=645275 RepID=A0A2P8DFY5_9ACTN|nr:helix-turn-helix domain-containing protein [Murinocardiopsis flavida]PSK96125.1 excisionase family DNA binding protein [Murinocardiopsis flavida]